ncbi:type II secretion system protein GspM [Thiolapillus brandeum]|uniref:General secretion pathway protein M n=1 Tax=Thiolapillus brandeum TaxID=1076588 RepID=A0A7U6GGX8_9GAMM|nr:type II secretion system protein GspM [Thiolapillus brandeum]BAO43426.1 general secretion pathway protein M [Thiolapillus brandeum]
MNLQGDKQRCILLLGGMGLLLVLVLALIIYPWWAKMQFYTRAVDQAADHIQRYQRLLDSAPGQRNSLRNLRQQLRKEKYFIAATNPELAAAELQKRVKTIVTGAQGKLVSTQKVDVQDEGPVREIKIKVRMKGDVEALSRVLHELESQLPIVNIDNVSIRSRRTVKGRRRNRVEGYELDVSLELMGYMLKGGGK